MSRRHTNRDRQQLRRRDLAVMRRQRMRAERQQFRRDVRPYLKG